MSAFDGGSTAVPANVAAVADPATIMARATGENFPVASRLLPKRIRAQLLSVYGFARLVDELGDSAPGDRIAALDWLQRQLDDAFAGDPGHPLMVPLAATIADRTLSREPFERLLQANRNDQRTTHYERFDDLLAYCNLSANPVGQLVLEIFGVANEQRIEQSNAVCTALQLLEHWQDIQEDLTQGRVYVPLEDLARFGCTLEDLQAPRVSDALRRVLSLEAIRTAALLDEGWPLVRGLQGWARVAIAGFVGGGRAELSALARADYEVLALKPHASRRRKIGSILRAFDGSVR
jgi:squalene synthase HpnC